jgi:hypothetical protein
VACLPALTATDLPNQADVLDQILWERRYELYLQAVRWSDLRRFGEPKSEGAARAPNSERSARAAEQGARSATDRTPARSATDRTGRAPRGRPYRPSNTSSTRRIAISASVTGIG